MITSARFTTAAEDTVAVTEADGTEWHAAWPGSRDTVRGGQLAAWIAEGGAIAPYRLDFAALKERYKAEVDREAEQQRFRHITPGEGQALTYLRKVEQATAALAAEKPKAADYPLLAASVGIDGKTICDVAKVVLARAAAWELANAHIERVRMTTKAAIDAATDVSGAEAARRALDWGTP